MSKTPVARKAARRRTRRSVTREIPARDRKLPLDLEDMFERIAVAVAPFPKAAMFELADRGYGSVFHILVGCIISIRTRDEVSLPTSLRLFEVAPTPQAVAKLTPKRIDQLIHAASFHEPKARQIHEIAQRTVADFGGELPVTSRRSAAFTASGRSARTWRSASRAARRWTWASAWTSTSTASPTAGAWCRPGRPSGR